MSICKTCYKDSKYHTNARVVMKLPMMFHTEKTHSILGKDFLVVNVVKQEICNSQEMHELL